MQRAAEHWPFGGYGALLKINLSFGKLFCTFPVSFHINRNKPEVKMITFDKVIVSDTIMENLIGQASKEGLLAVGADPQLEELSRRRSNNTQDLLALLVLFDHLLAPDFSNSFHIPKLEDAGLITFLPAESIPHQIATLQPDAKPEQTATAFKESLDLAETLRPLVLNRVISDFELNTLWSKLAQYLQTTEYEVCSAAMDYIKAFYYDSRMPEDNLLVRELPKDIRQTIDDDLGGQHAGLLGPAQLLFSSIILATHQILKLHLKFCRFARASQVAYDRLSCLLMIAGGCDASDHCTATSRGRAAPPVWRYLPQRTRPHSLCRICHWLAGG